MEQKPEFLTSTEVGNLLGVSIVVVRRWHRQGFLVAIRPMGRYLFPAAQPVIVRAMEAKESSAKVADDTHCIHCKQSGTAA